MHTFTWDSATKEEILDCDLLYQEDEEDEGEPSSSEEDLDSLPPYLRSLRESELRVPGEEAELGDPLGPEGTSLLDALDQ